MKNMKNFKRENGLPHPGGGIFMLNCKPETLRLCAEEMLDFGGLYFGGTLADRARIFSIKYHRGLLTVTLQRPMKQSRLPVLGYRVLKSARTVEYTQYAFQKIGDRLVFLGDYDPDWHTSPEFCKVRSSR